MFVLPELGLAPFQGQVRRRSGPKIEWRKDAKKEEGRFCCGIVKLL
jgi:hypothetical protein